MDDNTNTLHDIYHACFDSVLYLLLDIGRQGFIQPERVSNVIFLKK